MKTNNFKPYEQIQYCTDKTTIMVAKETNGSLFHCNYIPEQQHNYTKPNNALDFVNFTIVAKFNIFCCKVQGKIPSLNGFVENLNYIEKKERNTSLSKDTFQIY